MSTHDLFVYGTLMRRSERGNLLGDLRLDRCALLDRLLLQPRVQLSVEQPLQLRQLLRRELRRHLAPDLNSLF